jgi:hypothetical protein
MHRASRSAEAQVSQAQFVTVGPHFAARLKQINLTR